MTPTCQLLRDANRKLRILLDYFLVPEKAEKCETLDLAGVLFEVLRVGEWLGARAVPEGDSEVRLELDTYLKNLHTLREVLPKIQMRLLTERSRLEHERAHLESAAEWVRRARGTC